MSIGKAEIHPVGSLALGDLPLSSYDITPPAGSFQKVLFAASSWSGVTAVPAWGRQAPGPSAVRDGRPRSFEQRPVFTTFSSHQVCKRKLGPGPGSTSSDPSVETTATSGYSGLRAGRSRTFFQRANPASSAQTLFLVRPHLVDFPSVH